MTDYKKIVEEAPNELNDVMNYFIPVRYSAQEELYLLLNSYIQYLFLFKRNYADKNYLKFLNLSKDAFKKEFKDVFKYDDLCYLEMKLSKYNAEELKHIVIFNRHFLYKSFKTFNLKYIIFKEWFKNKFKMDVK